LERSRHLLGSTADPLARLEAGGTTFRYCIIFGNAGRSDTLISLEWLFLRHIRKIDELTSVRERDPRISHACKIFTLFRVVCFLRKHRALSGCFPCRVAFGSHLIFPMWRRPHALNATTMVSTEGLTFLLLKSICREPFFIVA